MIQRRVLRADEAQASLERVGYVVVPLLTPAEVAELYEWYSARAGADGPNPPGAYDDTYAEFSVIHSFPEFRAAAYEKITQTVHAATESLLVDYRPLVANFVNKPPGTGVVPAHQNWAVVDERTFRSVSVWIALVDCTIANGTLQMLDGSHEMFRGRRGMWSYHSFAPVEELLESTYLTPVLVRAGEAIVLDDALVHYSPPNETAHRRLAIQLVMIPEEAEPMFFQAVGQHGTVVDVQAWRVDERFFWNFWHGDGDERFGEPLERFELELPTYDAALIESLFEPRSPAPAG